MSYSVDKIDNEGSDGCEKIYVVRRGCDAEALASLPKQTVQCACAMKVCYTRVSNVSSALE